MSAFSSARITPSGGVPKSVQPGYSTVVTGDSITQANSSATNNSHGDTWATYMALASGGRMRLVRNYAIGGQRTTLSPRDSPTTY